MYVSIDFYNSTSREFILISCKNSPAFLNYTIIDELLNQKYIFDLKFLISMDSTNIIEILAYTIPSIITGAVAYFFDSHFKDQQNTRRWLLQKTIKQPPYRLQAYERMTLFMERINPSQLMVRIVPFQKIKTTIKFCNSTDRARI
jgi:hypothetical protein